MSGTPRVLLCFGVGAALWGQPKPAAFETSAKAIFAAKCVACHGAASPPQGGLDLRTAESVLKGGKSGPAVMPGASAKSLLIDKIDRKSVV